MKQHSHSSGIDKINRLPRNKSQAFTIAAFTGAIIIVATLLDPLVYTKIHLDGIYDKDLGRLFRVWGYLGRIPSF